MTLMHVYFRQANFTTKPRFEVKKLLSFAQINSQGRTVEKNTVKFRKQALGLMFFKVLYEGLILGGAYLRRENYVSKSIGLAF